MPLNLDKFKIEQEAYSYIEPKESLYLKPKPVMKQAETVKNAIRRSIQFPKLGDESTMTEKDDLT